MQIYNYMQIMFIKPFCDVLLRHCVNDLIDIYMQHAYLPTFAYMYVCTYVRACVRTYTCMYVCANELCYQTCSVMKL